MSLHFFADHCVANAVIAAISNAGHVVFRLRDHLRTDASDPVVIAKAQALDAILRTLNGDFTDIVSYPPQNYLGIVALRVRNHPEVTAQVTSRFLSYVSVHSQPSDYAGKLLIVEPHQIRIRS